jgi:hypothetical protein
VIATPGPSKLHIGKWSIAEDSNSNLVFKHEDGAGTVDAQAVLSNPAKSNNCAGSKMVKWCGELPAVE